MSLQNISQQIHWELPATTVLKGSLWGIQHYFTCENAVGELSWLLTAIKLGASKIVCLYSMFDNHRQVFTRVHGAICLLAIGKSAFRVNIMFMMPFMRGCLIHRGPLSWHLFLQKRRLNFSYWPLAIWCVLALSARCSTVSSASGRS
jgi:hypothetical protein